MTQSTTAADARIDELESRLALQDQAVLELGDEVYRQQQQIARLEAIVGRLTDRVASVEQAGAGSDLPDEPPPHY